MTTTVALHRLRGTRREVSLSGSGDAPALVLLHAFPLDHRMWTGVAAAMPPGTEILAPDLPGLGASAVPDISPALEAAADAVAAALDAASVQRAVVAGLSMGGYVALALAGRRPDLVAGLALVDTKSTADTDEAKANRLRIAREVEGSGRLDPVLPMATTLLGETSRAARPALIEQVTEWIRSQPPAGIAWSQRAMAARPDRTGVIQAFTGPVAVVVGNEDTLTPAAQADHMTVAARGASLVVVPGAGHLSAVEDPVAVAAVLADVLQAVAANRPR